MRRLAILGSTGSIGVQALDVVAHFPDRFEVVALAAGRNVERLAEQVRRFRPRLVAAADAAAAARLRTLVPPGTEVLEGDDGVVAAAVHPTSTSCWPPSRAAPACAPRPPRSRPARTWGWPTRSRWCWPAS